MKKIHFLWFALVAMSISILTACSDDVLVEPEQPQYTTAESFSPIGKWQFHDTVDEVVAGSNYTIIENLQYEFFDNDSLHVYHGYAIINPHIHNEEQVNVDVMGSYTVFYDAKTIHIDLDAYEKYGVSFDDESVDLDFETTSDLLIIPESDYELEGYGHYFTPARALHRVDDWE